MNPTLGAAIGAGVALGAVLLWWGFQPVPAMRPAPARRDRLPLTRTERIRAGAALGVAVLLAVAFGWVIMLLLLPVGAVLVPRIMSPPVVEDPARLAGIAKWVRSVETMLSAKTTLNTALVTASREAPEEIRPEATRLADRLALGWDTTAALYRFAEELASPAGDYAVAGLIGASTGSDAGLTAAMSTIALETMEEVKVRREIATARREDFQTVRFVTLVTIVVAAALVLVSPIGQFYRTPIGQVALLGFAGIYLALLLDIRNQATPRPPRRFLIAPEKAPH